MQAHRLIGVVRVMAIFCAATAIGASAQTFTTLVNFHGTNGQHPQAAMVQGTDGNLYGLTSGGGDVSPGGTVFRMTPAGELTTIYSFCSLANCADGSGPDQLLLAADGNFYGTTGSGGVNCQDLVNPGCGTVFKLTPAGALTTLYSFCSQANCADGWVPNSLVQGADGNFYGITGAGGVGYPNGFGTVFKITAAGVLTILHDFCSDVENGNCADGNLPQSLMLATNGNFYGIASEGGPDDCGEVFEITPAGALSIVYGFEAGAGCGDDSGLLQASDGNFYGTSGEGGAHRKGVVFKLTPSGGFSVLYAFCALANCADGENPNALVQGTDGNFYGTTHGVLAGSRTTDGTVFQLTPTGTLTTLHTFDFTDGAWPAAPLVQATNGIFYGSTTFGGASSCDASCGTLFSESMGLTPFVEASPNFGAVGRVVNILGNNLKGTTSVTFNGVSATFKVVSSSYSKAEVPTGATSGTIEVVTPTGTLDSNVGFQVLQ